MKIPLLDLKAQHETIRAEVRAALDRVVESQFFIQGPEVEALEREITAYSHCTAGVGCSSGTDAILIALMALGVGPGDEVVTSPNTFVATAMCVARLGARAVFVDTEPDSFNLDPARLERVLGPRTKVIMPVHLFGQMADMDAICAIANKRGLPVVEDGAQAIGAEWQGRRCGTWGAFGTLSFFPSKNLGGYGDGGMLVGRDEQLMKRARLIRNQGQEPKYFSKVIGGNFRLDALQAAILRAKLPHLDAWTLGRQRNAARYRTLFAGKGLDVTATRLSSSTPLVLPRERPGVRHVYNQFVIRAARRDELKAFLGERGIGTEVYYPQPMHLQECFSMWAGRPGDYPEAESACSQTLAIPIFPELTDAQAAYVVDSVMEFLAKAS